MNAALASPSSLIPFAEITPLDAPPRTALPVVLTAATVAAIAMSVDRVPSYGYDAFAAGMVLTVAFAAITARAVDRAHVARRRLLAMLLLPAVLGAIVGMVVQALVLVSDERSQELTDLGGLVATTEPAGWIAGGIALGAAPALALSLFLLAVSRSARRIAGHDATERFHVAFVGSAGLLATTALTLVHPVAQLPLLFVVLAAVLLLPIGIVADRARLVWLARVYGGKEPGVELVPAARFANDGALAPLVQSGGTSFVVVRRVYGGYRGAAVEALALVGETERATRRPIVRRMVVSGVMVGGMLLGAAASLLAIAAR